MEDKPELPKAQLIDRDEIRWRRFWKFSLWLFVVVIVGIVLFAAFVALTFKLDFKG